MKTLVRKEEGKVAKRLVWGEVVAPNRPILPDKGTTGPSEFMTAESIETMAYDFMRQLKLRQIDVQHNNKLTPGVTVVESFIARPGDPDFIEGAWVLGVHVDDDELWRQIEDGELNGYSMEAWVFRESVEVEIEIPPIVTGSTDEVDGHTHTFTVQYGMDAEFLGGETDEVSTDTVPLHKHAIIGGTITQLSAGHRHRFSAVDNITVVEPE
jgi:hypothetical protein